jgi:hypothetical protein
MKLEASRERNAVFVDELGANCDTELIKETPEWVAGGEFLGDDIAFVHEISESSGGSGDAFAHDDVGAVQRAVAVGGFSGFLLSLEDIFEVIRDLISEATGVGELLEEGACFLRGTGEEGGEDERETEKGDGFAFGDFQNAVGSVVFGPETEVAGLSAENAVGPEAGFDEESDGACLLCWKLGRLIPDEGVGAIDDGEGGEHCSGFAKEDVRTPSTPAQLGIVHAGEVIEYEGGSVEIFDGNGDALAAF